MEREVDEFGLLSEDRPKLEKIEDGFIPASVVVGIKKYNENSRGIYLSRDFFYPYTGYKPEFLYFSIRKINNTNFLFIDDVQPLNEGLIPFIKRTSNPNFTHCAIRKVTLNKDGTVITSIPCQIIALLPEIKTHNKMRLIRVQISKRPTDVRWQALLI